MHSGGAPGSNVTLGRIIYLWQTLRIRKHVQFKEGPGAAPLHVSRGFRFGLSIACM